MDVENIKKAIAVLRDKSTWPKGFKWDFTQNCQCAMALLPRVLNFAKQSYHEYGYIGSIEMSDYLEIESSQATDIFIMLNGSNWENTTSEDVADALEKLL